MSKTIAVFQASRKELWSAICAANLADGNNWKQSSREQMISMAIKGNIEHVNVIGESDAVLKKLAKTFTPSFFKSIRDLETLFASVSDITSDVGVEPEAEDLVLEPALKKN